MEEKVIIIVDDEEELHLLYQTVLKKHIKEKKIDLLCFLNGKLCLDYIHTKISDGIFKNNIYIFSDINMPQMDGFILLQEIRKYKYKIPFWIVSAYDSKEVTEKCKKLGACGILTKPVSYKKILEIAQIN